MKKIIIISPGKVTSVNLDSEEEILETNVVKTYVDGELVYRKPLNF